MDVRAYTSIYEGGEDLLSNLVEDLKKEARDEEEANEEKEEEEVEEVDRCDDILARLETMHSYGTGKATRPPEEEIQSEKKSKKSKYRAPEYIIIFDDLSSELKSKSLTSLLKFNRHFKAKLIISSQWIHDLLPESRKQIDLFLIFKGFPDKKLIEIYKDCDSGVPFETFLKVYNKRLKRLIPFFTSTHDRTPSDIILIKNLLLKKIIDTATKINILHIDIVHVISKESKRILWYGTTKKTPSAWCWFLFVNW